MVPTLALVLAAGCFPTPDPPWLIGDQPELLALRIDVTKEGDYSAIIGATPADRTRTEALPGDTIALHPWVADRTRVWPEEELDIAYFACFGFDCLGALQGDVAQTPCGGTIDLQSPTCFIGRGSSVELTLPTGPLVALAGAPTILAVGGVPGVGDTGRCVDTLSTRPIGDLHDCMLLERYVAIGPRWVIALLLADEDTNDDDTGGIDTDGDTEGETDGEYTPPPEVFLEWPNFSPEVERFAIVVTRGGVAHSIDALAGDRIHVRARDHVELAYVGDPRDIQQFAVDADDDGNITRRIESSFEQWFATYVLDPFAEDPAGLESVEFEVPADVAELRVDLQLEDGNGGVGWGSVIFEVDGNAK